jgi:hypothetical protein
VNTHEAEAWLLEESVSAVSELTPAVLVAVPVVIPVNPRPKLAVPPFDSVATVQMTVDTCVHVAGSCEVSAAPEGTENVTRTFRASDGPVLDTLAL